MSGDLYAAADPFEKAPCGFVPRDGWFNKWSLDGHRDTCSRCDDIEAEKNAAAEKAVGEPGA